MADGDIGELGSLFNVFEFYEIPHSASMVVPFHGERRSVHEVYQEMRLYSLWQRQSVVDVAEMTIWNQLHRKFRVIEDVPLREVTPSLSTIRMEKEREFREVLREYERMEVDGDLNLIWEQRGLMQLTPLLVEGGADFLEIPTSFEVWPHLVEDEVWHGRRKAAFIMRTLANMSAASDDEEEPRCTECMALHDISSELYSR